jgi:hypothetical protein
VAGVYRLDDLGSFQFERLCETVTTSLGLDSVAWDGTADQLRSALVAAALHVPELGAVLEGPVLLAIVWSPPGETERTGSLAATLRFALLESALADRKPRALVALTNCPLTDGVRAQLEAELEADPDCHARHLVIATEQLACLLDSRADIRRALPSVLGLRELDDLVEGEAGAHSTGDVDAARQLARVFVPTRAYVRALDVLDRHRFVVLTGPPEMGKTAIARMIGLELLTEGWEFHECVRPDELWKVFDRGRRQVFVADDAFGSTEYRPEAAERWALDLYRVLHAMDERHRLIWTSRPAPLKAGLRRIHREHGVEHWPQPAEIEIAASDLEVEEKAVILFRHAKAAALPPAATALVKERGPAIVAHEHFTPERIRRFVSDRLPTLGDEPELTERAVLDEIREPTVAMAASLRALEPPYRTLLVSLLDVPPGPVPAREVATAARRHLGGGLPHAPNELVERLTDHFLAVVPPDAVTWVHPSWRDLVIDDLASDGDARRRFLGHCSIDGVLLALSTAGGAVGERNLPLLLEDGDWDALTGRVSELLLELDDPQIARLLASLEAAGRAFVRRRAGDDPAREVQALARYVLEHVAQRWARNNETIPLGLLEAWFTLAAQTPRAPDPPDVARTWSDLAPVARIDLHSRPSLVRFDDWLRLVAILLRWDPKAFAALNHGEQDELVAAFAYGVASELEAGESPETADLLAQCIGRIRQLRQLGWYSVAANRAWHAVRSDSVPERESSAPPRPPRREPAQAELVTRILADL